LADLLESRELASVTNLSWRKLSAETDISIPTLLSWHNARVGGDQYLQRIEADTADKLMKFFDLDNISQLIVVVSNENSEDNPPQLLQETAIAAAAA
jgi:hypothetical protein